MKKVMCFAVSMFMLVNLSFAATLSFRPIKNFKADKIQLSRRPPAGMTSGQVYFRWLAPYLFNEVDALGYTFNEVDNLNITWAQADEGGW